MTNHLHFLLQVKIAEHLAKFIKFIAQKYSQYINRLYKRTGIPWEGRFRSCYVSLDNYLLACSGYIEMYPVEAGLVKEPAGYEWSSFRGKVAEKEDKLIDYDPWYKSLGDTLKERQ